MKSRFFEILLTLGLQLIRLAVNKLMIRWPERFIIKSDLDSIKREVKQWRTRNKQS